MHSKLGPYLAAQLRRRGWTMTAFSERSGIPLPTISRLMNNPTMMPDLTTLVQVAVTLEVQPATLLEQIGFRLPANRSQLDIQAQLAEQVAQVPGLRALLPTLSALEPAHQEAAIAYVQWIIDHYGSHNESRPDTQLRLRDQSDQLNPYDS